MSFCVSRFKWGGKIFPHVILDREYIAPTWDNISSDKSKMQKNYDRTYCPKWELSTPYTVLHGELFFLASKSGDTK